MPQGSGAISMIEIPMNELIEEAKDWEQAQLLWQSANESLYNLAIELYKLRCKYPDTVVFSQKRAQYLPSMDVQTAVKLVNAGRNLSVNPLYLKILNREGIGINSLSVDAFLEFSKASALVQEEVVKATASGVKVSARKIREMDHKVVPPKKEEPKKEEPKISSPSFGNKYEHWMLKDMFRILGIDDVYTEWAIIEYAIKRRKQQWHPDKGGNQEKFNDIIQLEARLERFTSFKR